MKEGERALQAGYALLPEGLSLVHVDQSLGIVRYITIDQMAMEVPIAEASPRCLVPALAALREMFRRAGGR